jgi:hypothetical protein
MSNHQNMLHDKENNNDMAAPERSLPQTYFPSILPDLDACSSTGKVSTNTPQRFFSDVFLDTVEDKQSGLRIFMCFKLFGAILQFRMFR